MKLEIIKYRYGGPVIVKTIGTREQLIQSGLAADYMFGQLGNQNSRKGPTEYGDRFRLDRRAKSKFSFSLRLLPTAEIPIRMATADPYTTDIGHILERISAPR